MWRTVPVMQTTARASMNLIRDALGGAYASAYWCLFPPTAQEKVAPRLQDCQDNLQERLAKLQQRASEMRSEMQLLRTHRDKTRLRRLFLEYRSLGKDIAVTENTLWTVDRQLQLIERSELDGLIIDTLQKSSIVLNGMQRELPQIGNVEEITETLQARMQEINDVNDTLSAALQRGVDDDYATLEQDLESFLNDETCTDPLTLPPPPTALLQQQPHTVALHLTAPLRVEDTPSMPQVSASLLSSPRRERAAEREPLLADAM